MNKTTAGDRAIASFEALTRGDFPAALTEAQAARAAGGRTAGIYADGLAYGAALRKHPARVRRDLRRFLMSVDDSRWTEHD